MILIVKGEVIARSYNQFRQSDVKDLIMKNIDIDNSEIHTDEYRVYNKVNRLTSHKTVNHGAKQYVKGNVHTNSIEGFWSLVKRAHYGQHHHYSRQYTDLYIAEAVFKYNHRKLNQTEVFNSIIGGLVNV